MKFKNRWIALLTCGALLTGMLAGCGGAQEPDAQVDTTQTAGGAVSATVGTWKTAQTLTPYFYEDFAPDGSAIEIKPFTNPGDQKTALLAGSLDMTGTTIPTAIQAAAAGEPIKIVTSLCNKCSALVVGKDSDIQSPADLKGKTIAYVPGTMHHVLLLDVLRRAGLDPDRDVTLTRIDFFDMGQALSGGQIDAFLSGEPYPSQAVRDGYGRILSYPYFDDSIGTINAAMIVTEDTIAQRPELVQALVNAHVQATQYMANDPDAWLDLAASFGTERELLEASAENIELCWDIDDTYIQNTENLAQQMLELGLIDHIPDIEAMFDLTFVENARQSAT